MATCTDVTKAFADRLSELVNEKKKDGKAVKDIAEESGVPSGSISKYQNDAGEAGINSLVKLADYFGVSADYLLGLTDVASGNADDMAIEQRLGLNSTSIEALNHFHTKDGSSFLNMLFERGFWEIVLKCQTSFETYIQAIRDESYTFRTSPEERLLYNVELSDYSPVRVEDDLAFTLTLTAEHYYDFCVQQACSQIEGFLKELADDVVKRVVRWDKEAAENG